MAPFSLMLIDDHAGIRQALRRALIDTAELAIVAEASSVGTALPLVLKTQPDALVVDFHLPDGNALDVLRGLKQLTPLPLVIVFTSFVSPALSALCLRHGATHVFDKSVDLPQLRHSLQEAAQRVAPPQPPVRDLPEPSPRPIGFTPTACERAADGHTKEG